MLRPGSGRTSIETRDIGLKTNDGVELSASFYPAKSAGQPAPAALLVHDAGASREQLADVAVRLQKDGFGVLLLDLRSHGQSGGKAWAELDVPGRKTAWATAIRDVDSGAEWLRSQASVQRTNLSVVGIGAGCALAARHAVKDENTRTVALLAPPAQAFGFDVSKDLEQLGGLSILLLADREARSEATLLVEQARKAQGAIVKDRFVDNRDVLADKSTGKTVADFLKEAAFPKKSKGK
jgi:pimeloyl-ACP methyl ester carboxylesterase